METLFGKLSPIVFSHLAAGGLMWFAKNKTTLPKGGHFGIYLIIVPIGFIQFGADLPNWSVSIMVLGGIIQILLSLRLEKKGVPDGSSSEEPRSNA